jgi:two-component system, NarL family, invasion response regulator UvrY
MTRLVIADDHPLIRAGFREIAARDPAIKVVGEAGDGAALREVLRKTGADVVALDINMPGPGFEALIRGIREEFPRVHVLIVSMYAEGELALQAFRAGAAGYVTKGEAEVELLAAVRKVARGGKYVTPSLAEWLATELADGRVPGKERLSARERQVLRLLADGKSYKEIAAQLAVSAKSVGTYRSRLLSKLHLKTTADLIRYAVEHDVQP